MATHEDFAHDALLQPVDGPGKFEGSIKLAEVLHDLSLDSSYPDETGGDVTETGVFGCLFTNLDERDETRGKIGDVKAAILYEDANGFISCDTFADNAAAWTDWKAFTSDNERFYLGEERLYALGFDRGSHGCSQCDAISINGMPCHETGCPNEPTPELDYNDEEG